MVSQATAVAAVEAQYKGCIESTRAAMEQKVDASNLRVCRRRFCASCCVLELAQADSQIAAAIASAEGAKNSAIADARREFEERARNASADSDR